MSTETDGLKVYTDAFDAAFAKVLVTSKRDVQVVAEEQMRGVMRHLIGITPPAHIVQANETGAWSVVQGGAARVHGAALVKSDIQSVYGTPRQLYDRIREKDEASAKAFWRHHSRHDTPAASAVARAAVGAGLYGFDGGKAHQGLKKGRARGRAKTPLFYLEDVRPLKGYIREIQDRVGWLAAGWNEAAAALGVKPPQWIWRHAAPGAIVIRVSETGIRMIATNAVTFASQINDMNRRVQYALDQQAEAMLRRFDSFVQSKFKTAGFAVLST